MADRQNIVVLGAGPTGLSAAWRLQELGHSDWLLLDAADEPGGLACSVVDDAGFTWDMGGHVVFSHYEYFDRLLDSLIGDWLEHQRESWVWIRERFIPYPFQHNIWKLPAEDLARCIDGLLEVEAARLSGKPQTKPANFAQWIAQNFGPGLADVFMTPYNRKVWAYDPSKLAAAWMGERVATVDLKRSIHNLIFKRDDVSWGPNARFRFPLHGGTGAIWKALANRLDPSRVRLKSTVVAVDTTKKTLRLSDGSIISYDKLISTMPLDTLLRIIVDQPSLTALAPGFVHSSTHVIGIGIDEKLSDAFATKCWMYFSEPQFPFYRMTVFSNYSPNNVPIPGRQSSLMCEVAESPDTPIDGATVTQRCIDSLQEAGLLRREAPIISKFHRRLEHGYPTPFVLRDELLSRVEPALVKLGIYSRGRFGGWKYEVSNQDHSSMQGVEAANHLLLGTPELTIHDPEHVNRSGKRTLAELPGDGKVRT